MNEGIALQNPIFTQLGGPDIRFTHLNGVIPKEIIEARIPKRFHFIWFGEIPAWVRYNISTFANLNPSYDILVHADASLLLDWMKPLYDKCKCAQQRSDLLRVSILQKIPGWYMDCDNRCFKSFDLVYDIIKHDKRIVVPDWPGTSDVFNNVMGASRSALWEHINNRFKEFSEFLVNNDGYNLEYADFGTITLRCCRRDLQVVPSPIFYDNYRARTDGVPPETIIGHDFKG